jgi:imidazolonepropionase-like amidohydrolase
MPARPLTWLIVGVVGLTASIAWTHQPADRPVAFVDVSVVPMDGERVLPAHTVVVRADRIVAMGPSRTTEIPNDALRVEGSGRFLMPGLADMHTHVIHGRRPDFMTFYLANGVTTIRSPGENLGDELETRDRLAAGDILGPRMYSAGKVIDGDPSAFPGRPGGAPVATPEAGRREVLRQRGDGVDFIKTYEFLAPQTFAAIAAAARELQLPLIGHVPQYVGPETALRLGLSSIEHMETISAWFQRNDSPYVGQDERIALLRSGYAEGVDNLLWRHIDFDKVRAVARQIVAAGASFVPTLTAYQNDLLPGELDARLRRPEMRYVADSTIGMWQKSNYAPDNVRVMREVWDQRVRAVRIFHEEGVPLMLGTDAPVAFTVPGWSVHQELANLVSAGLSPYEALRTATLHPAQWLGQADRAGTLAVGKQADLLLVGGNPLDAVSHAANPLGVMTRGRWLPRAELERLLGPPRR